MTLERYDGEMFTAEIDRACTKKEAREIGQVLGMARDLAGTRAARLVWQAADDRDNFIVTIIEKSDERVVRGHLVRACYRAGAMRRWAGLGTDQGLTVTRVEVEFALVFLDEAMERGDGVSVLSQRDRAWKMYHARQAGVMPAAIAAEHGISPERVYVHIREGRRRMEHYGAAEVPDLRYPTSATMAAVDRPFEALPWSDETWIVLSNLHVTN